MITRQGALARIEELAGRSDAVIGVAAKHLDSGEILAVNDSAPFPTASTFKTPLLYELYRQIDQGRIDPATRIRLEDRHRVPGSGVLQDLDAGAELTVKDIATLMITVSDNAGTDIIYDLVGREAVAGALAHLGMTATHLPLDTWELLAGLHDLDPNDPSLTYDALRRRMREHEASWDCRSLQETPANDISTPRDMLLLMEAIHQGIGLSPAARDAILDILLRQKLNEIIPALLPFGVQVAHKTGSLKGVRNDVGLAFAGDTVYAIALMSKRAGSTYQAIQTLAQISRVVYERFTGIDQPT